MGSEYDQMVIGLIISGLIIACCGYMVRFHRKEAWIAGYDPAEVSDPKAVATWFGSHLLWMGITGLLLALICWIFPVSTSYEHYPVLGYVLVVIAWCGYLGISGRKFTKDHRSTSS